MKMKNEKTNDQDELYSDVDLNELYADIAWLKIPIAEGTIDRVLTDKEFSDKFMANLREKKRTKLKELTDELFEDLFAAQSQN
nr:MAG TPA: hypothetical protein [Caudoviricetes sp.]